MKKIYLVLSLAFLFLLGCENHLEMTLPEGPQGEQGPQGEDGLSAFELWKILYGKDPNTPMEDFFNSLRGKDGKDGAVPVIGENGNWVIDGTDTGIPATGKDGKNGVTPVIGENDNWFIDGVDTGVPARGKDGNTPEIGEDGNWVIGDINTGIPAKGQDGADGEDGKDGLTPEIGENGNWVIGDFDTGIPAEGKDGSDGQDGADGEDGITPEIGENGNWIIGDYDTGVPAEGKDGADGEDGQDGKDGDTPRIGEDGNWIIGDFETGIPATGKDGADGSDGQDGNHGNDGVDGKSTYELWKDGVDKGTIINKDGSKYEGDNSWESFLKWLQGGDISVLHQHWLSLGNTGDLDAFIEALFDCHCDGISIAVVADNPCIELNSDGSVAKTYNAKLIVSAEAGTEVKASVEGGQSFTKTVPTGQSQVEFNFARGDDNKTVTILAKPSGDTEQVTKIAQIPALKYIKLGSANLEQVTGEEKDVATVTFEEAPVELYVNTVLVYDTNGIVESSGWEVSADGKTFTRTFERGASKQKLSFRAVGDDDACSILTGLLEIPQLTPVVVDDPTVEVRECDVTVTLTGTTGMTVNAKASNDQSNPKTMNESPAGTYTASFPRKYGAYTIEILAGKTGAGNVTKTVSIDGNKLLPTPFTYSFVGGGTSNTENPIAIGSFTNPLGTQIVLEITRSRNTRSSAKERAPWVEGSPGINTTKEVTIPAGETVGLQFHRDVAPNFADGNYTVTIKTTSQCGEPFSKTHKIYNQRDFNYRFERQDQVPGGYPGPDGEIGGTAPFDPDYDAPKEKEGYTIFEVIVTDAIPGSHVQFLLNTSNGFGSVWGGGKKTDEDGNLKILVQMKDSDIEIANGKKAEFKFSDEKLSTEFFHTKEITFNLPLD